MKCSIMQLNPETGCIDPSKFLLWQGGAALCADDVDMEISASSCGLPRSYSPYNSPIHSFDIILHLIVTQHHMFGLNRDVKSERLCYGKG